MKFESLFADKKYIICYKYVYILIILYFKNYKQKINIDCQNIGSLFVKVINGLHDTQISLSMKTKFY